MYTISLFFLTTHYYYTLSVIGNPGLSPGSLFFTEEISLASGATWDSCFTSAWIVCALLVTISSAPTAFLLCRSNDDC